MAGLAGSPSKLWLTQGGQRMAVKTIFDNPFPSCCSFHRPPGHLDGSSKESLFLRSFRTQRQFFVSD